MDEERALIESLTKAEREALQAFLEEPAIKVVARKLGRSPFAVEQRLKRARQKLGVKRSIDAAHMLARVEPDMYGLPIYASSSVAEDEEIVACIDPVEEGGRGFAWPFPTKGRPWNDSSVSIRIIAIAVGVFLATASVLLAASLLEQIGRIVRQLL